MKLLADIKELLMIGVAILILLGFWFWLKG
jgi:hypothetical protein